MSNLNTPADDWDDCDDRDYDGEMEPECLICGGEKFIPGEEINDGFDDWYDPGTIYP